MIMPVTKKASVPKASVPKATVLGRTLNEVIAAMPPESQARIAEQTAQLQADVEGLKALRKLAQRSQEQIAQSFGVKQPAIVKIERQTDLYLSTLRRFVEAAGGTMELRIDLPGTGAFTLTGVGEIEAAKDAA